jgi:hypothetical protein
MRRKAKCQELRRGWTAERRKRQIWRALYGQLRRRGDPTRPVQPCRAPNSVYTLPVPTLINCLTLLGEIDRIRKAQASTLDGHHAFLKATSACTHGSGRCSSLLLCLLEQGACSVHIMLPKASGFQAGTKHPDSYSQGASKRIGQPNRLRRSVNIANAHVVRLSSIIVKTRCTIAK